MGAAEDELLFHLAMQDLEPDEAVEQPEALAYLRRMRKLGFGTKWFDGGYSEQPHILMREFETVIDAEHEHAQLTATNLRIQAEAAQNGSNSTQNSQ